MPLSPTTAAMERARQATAELLARSVVDFTVADDPSSSATKRQSASTSPQQQHDRHARRAWSTDAHSLFRLTTTDGYTPPPPVTAAVAASTASPQPGHTVSAAKQSRPSASPAYSRPSGRGGPNEEGSSPPRGSAPASLTLADLAATPPSPAPRAPVAVALQPATNDAVEAAGSHVSSGFAPSPPTRASTARRHRPSPEAAPLHYHEAPAASEALIDTLRRPRHMVEARLRRAVQVEEALRADLERLYLEDLLCIFDVMADEGEQIASRKTDEHHHHHQQQQQQVPRSPQHHHHHQRQPPSDLHVADPVAVEGISTGGRPLSTRDANRPLAEASPRYDGQQGHNVATTDPSPRSCAPSTIVAGHPYAVHTSSDGGKGLATVEDQPRPHREHRATKGGQPPPARRLEYPSESSVTTVSAGPSFVRGTATNDTLADMVQTAADVHYTPPRRPRSALSETGSSVMAPTLTPPGHQQQQQANSASSTAAHPHHHQYQSPVGDSNNTAVLATGGSSVHAQYYYCELLQCDVSADLLLFPRKYVSASQSIVDRGAYDGDASLTSSCTTGSTVGNRVATAAMHFRNRDELVVANGARMRTIADLVAWETRCLRASAVPTDHQQADDSIRARPWVTVVRDEKRRVVRLDRF